MSAKLHQQIVDIMKYKHLRIIDRSDIRLANYTLSRDCSAIFRKNYKSYAAIAINIFRNSPEIQRLVLVINENIKTVISKKEGRINKLVFYIAKTRFLKKGICIGEADCFYL
jgi:hypothetical protein